MQWQGRTGGGGGWQGCLPSFLCRCCPPGLPRSRPGSGWRPAAVQLVRLRAVSQAQAAAAFGVDPVTVWRWDQALAAGGVAGLVPSRRGPKGASKLTPELAARIRELDAA